MKKVIIVGGAGFIGSHLTSFLEKNGYEVVVADRVAPRDENTQHVIVDGGVGFPQDNDKLQHPYAVINLMGKGIFGRFTPAHKRAIYESRISTTKNLIDSFENEKLRPEVYVQASAVGFYGDRGEDEIDEDYRMGTTFLAHVANDWEHAGRRAEQLGIQTMIMRNAHVLGSGGLIASLLPMYKRGLGGSLAGGEQWFPWVHIEDLVHIYKESMENNNYWGVVNVVSGTHVRQKDFSKILALTLGKKEFLSIPKWALRMRYGSFADEITVSQKISSKVLDGYFYKNKHSDISTALQDILDPLT